MQPSEKLIKIAKETMSDYFASLSKADQIGLSLAMAGMSRFTEKDPSFEDGDLVFQLGWLMRIERSIYVGKKAFVDERRSADGYWYKASDGNWYTAQELEEAHGKVV